MTPETWQKMKPILERALAMPVEARRGFLEEECADEVMRREAESLLEFENANAGSLEGSAISIVTKEGTATSMIGRKIGRYEIVSELGAGGMGAVYLAKRADGEFTQEVALKLIRSGIGSESILRRFYSERQILASLDHPNIAHLIDGGTTDDNLPYFVMEYVKGEPIVEFAGNSELGLEDRLDLFRKVCDGISYAHQNLVIHRDLKPSNILVNKDGIPKLLDFGIAKLLKDSSDGATATHQMAFTPEYASPEQIRGENLSTATDVYSLGVVLYELLTGVRPFRFEGKNFGQIVLTASETAPAKPSQAESREPSLRKNASSAGGLTTFDSRVIRGDLDNIVLKALNKEPARRYSSVEQLSEDIRRHLKGLPVFARQDSWRYRAEKFARRNPLVVGSVALAFVILIAGIAATTYQAQRADAERERAERRFNDVRVLANSFIFEINAKIAESPIEARELVVERGLEYLDKLSAEAEGDATLQSELAAAYQKIGNLQAEIFAPGLGKTSAALSSHRKALEIRERLLVLEPNNKERVLDSIQSRIDVANILSMNGKIAEARDEYRQAVSQGETAAAASPGDAQLRRILARSYSMLGQSILRSGSLTATLENYKRALSIYRQLESETPDSQTQSLSIVSAYIGYVKLEMGETGEAIKYYKSSLALLKKFLSGKSENLASMAAISSAEVGVGVATSYVDPDKALNHIQKALELQKIVVDADKKNFSEVNGLADCFLELGRVLLIKAEAGGGNSRLVLNEAVVALQTAIKHYDTVRQSDLENISVLRQVSFARINLGRVYTKQRNKALAIATYEQALAESEQVNKRDEMNSEFRHDKAVCLLRLSELGKNAASNLNAALPILEKLVAESPEHVERRYELERAKDLHAKL